MSRNDLVSETPLLRLSMWILDVQHLHFDIHTAQTWKEIVMFGPVINIQGIRGLIEVASHNYFAYLDETHSDYTFFLVSNLSQFQQVKDGGWRIVTNKQLDGGGLSFSDDEHVYVDFTFIGTS